MPESLADDTTTVLDLIDERWQGDPDAVVMRHADDDDVWTDVTAAEARALVRLTAKGLIARGVAAGDKVALMSRTRYEWTILDLAIMSVGAIPVPIYDTSSSAQVDWIVSDSESAWAIVETASHADTVRPVLDDPESPLTAMLVIDDGAVVALQAEGASVTDAALAERIATVTPDGVATMIYTSGTTGRPKGVLLTQRSYVHMVRAHQEAVGGVIWPDGEQGSTVLFLTLAHALARVVQFSLVASGTNIGYCPDTKRLLPLLATMKPTLVLAVPRVFEKVYNSAEQKASDGGKEKIFRWAAKQAIDYSKGLDTEKGPSLAVKARHAIAMRLVLNRIVAALGGNARHAVSGSAPLGERLSHFYRGIGVQVLEGYGLTETNATTHVNRVELSKMNTVGKPLVGVEVRIADDGEILMRGDHFFTGYHHNPEATAAAFEDGWFKTGDIGFEDEDGYLTITGRKKEIIVTAGGKNVAPAGLEEAVRSYPVISQCVVVGDAKPFIAALITLDPEALPGWLRSKDLPELTPAEAAQHPAVLERVQFAVDRANSFVSRAESIRTFRVLDSDFTVDNGMMTPSLKVKRQRVLDEYSGEIDSIYSA